MTYALIGVALVAVAGWFFAWRARGETNTAGDRARLAEAKSEAALTRVFGAESAAAVAAAQYKAMELTLAEERKQLADARAEKADLLDRIAKLGVPVGDVLFDSTIDRLYANRDRAGGGASPGAGGDKDAVPGGPAGASPDAAKKG